MDITVRMNLNDKQIKRAVDKEMKPTLMGAGRYVMNIVRASIHQRRDPNKSASPMHQPFSHKTHPSRTAVVASSSASMSRSRRQNSPLRSKRPSRSISESACAR